MQECKITILKRTFHRDLIEEYKTVEVAEQLGPCDLFAEGQEFIVSSPWSPPEGFCTWAWADIRQYIITACLGGEFPNSRPADVFITCCTDGYRPVIFKVERLD